MPAPKGNKNAEKWTEQESKKLVDSVLDYVENTADCYFIGEAVTSLGEYRELWNYISKKFDFHTIKKVESILESRLVKAGLTNSTNPAMTIFTLKNNYNWTDKVQNDNISSDGSMTPPRTLRDLYREENAVSESES